MLKFQQLLLHIILEMQLVLSVELEMERALRVTVTLMHQDMQLDITPLVVMCGLVDIMLNALLVLVAVEDQVLVEE